MRGRGSKGRNVKSYHPQTPASRALTLAERDVAAERAERLKWSVIVLCVLAAALLGGCQSAPTLQAHPQAPFYSTVAFTGSMRPTLWGGEKVLIIPQDYAKLHAGQIVVYINFRGVQVIHRLVRQKPDGWTVKGDFNGAADYVVPGVDDLVTPENFVGIWIDSRDRRTWP